MKLSLSWFQLFPFICKLIWKVSSFLLLLSLTCVTAIGLFKIDRVTIGARPHNFHLEISFNFKVFVQLLKQICQNHEIYLVVKQYNWLCHKIGLRPQTFHLEPSFISKQFCNTSWISIQAKLHHYATINSWFHQNMRREYPFMCKAGRWPTPIQCNRDSARERCHQFKKKTRICHLPCFDFQVWM